MYSNTYLQRIQEARQASLSSHESSIAIFDELERLMQRIEISELPARTHSELKRFLESDLSMQRARHALINSLDGILGQLQATADGIEAKEAAPPSFVGTMELPDVDLSDLMDHAAVQNPLAEIGQARVPVQEPYPEPEPEWMAQVVSLSDQTKKHHLGPGSRL